MCRDRASKGYNICDERLTKTGGSKKEVKIALSIFLFQERAISLGKATELTKISRVRFIEVLKEHGIPAYEYGDEDFVRDQQMIVEYREMIEK